MLSADFIWGKVLSHMTSLLGDTVVATWFDEAEVLDLKDKKLVLYTPSEMRREFIKTRYGEYIKAALSDLFQMNDVQIEVLDEAQRDRFLNKVTHVQNLVYNPKYTFDRFVVGPTNQLACAAAQAVAQELTTAYNPLFIYGASGLGKTHLLYAIAGEINKRSPEKKIVYIKGDQFTNELVQAVKDGSMMDFRSRYRGADLFLMDDVHFIAGKDSTQEEFFNTFNELFEHQKQIVLTSDRPPNEMARLEDRLRTRFEWGVIMDIQPPDYEMRVAIIQKKCHALGIDFPGDVVAFIAENITNNVRQLEGTVNKIKAYHELTGMVLCVETVSRVVKDMYKGKADTLPTPDLIIKETARYFNLDPSLITSKQQGKTISTPRHVAMYLVRRMTNLSLPDTGKVFFRDHSTVVSACNKIETAMQDPRNPMNDVIRDVMENINTKL